MTLRQTLVGITLRGISRVLLRLDIDQLARVPKAGPLILVANHVNFLDVPVVFTRLLPRPVTGFAKIETWDNPFKAFLFSTWDAIPIRRGEADMRAMRAGLDALNAGKILAIAPEGTRSSNGRLAHGHPGVAMLALMSGAPLLPLVYYGHEQFNTHIRRLRRCEFHVRVGEPFHLSANGVKVTREIRQQMADEIMGQLAALLPPEYHGVYADRSASSYLRFSPPAAATL